MSDNSDLFSSHLPALTPVEKRQENDQKATGSCSSADWLLVEALAALNNVHSRGLLWQALIGVSEKGINLLQNVSGRGGAHIVIMVTELVDTVAQCALSSLTHCHCHYCCVNLPWQWLSGQIYSSYVTDVGTITDMWALLKCTVCLRF